MVSSLPKAACLRILLTSSMKLPKKSTLLTAFHTTLPRGLPGEALKAYLTQVKKWCPAQPVIHIDDSDVVKPDGYKFESLGWVRDGSESTATKNLYKKGYHVTGSHGPHQQQSSA